MVQIVYMGIVKNDCNPPIELCGQYFLDNFSRFYRGSLKGFINVGVDIVAANTGPGVRQSVRDDDDDLKGGGQKESKQKREGVPFHIHAYGRAEGVCGIVVSDLDYDKIAAHSIVSKLVDEFCTQYPRSAYANINQKQMPGDTPPLSMPQLEDYIKQYQDPEQANSLTKLQRELNETIQILQKTVGSLSERGDKMSDLVAKSELLSTQSKMFYTQAKKQNSCCVVM